MTDSQTGTRPTLPERVRLEIRAWNEGAPFPVRAVFYALVFFVNGAVALLIAKADNSWAVIGLVAVAQGMLLGSPSLLSRRPREEPVSQIADVAQHLAAVVERLDEDLVVSASIRRLEADPDAVASLQRFEEEVARGVRRLPDSLEERIGRWGE